MVEDAILFWLELNVVSGEVAVGVLFVLMVVLSTWFGYDVGRNSYR